MLTSRPNHLNGVVDVGVLRLRLKEFAPKLLLCTAAEAQQQVSAFLDGYGAIDYVVNVDVEPNGETMIAIGVQLKENGPFFFVPVYLAATVQHDADTSQLSLFEEQPWN